MTTRISLVSACLVAAVLLAGPFTSASAQDCSPQSPCEMTLYLMPGDQDFHVKYGDTLTLSYDGNKSKLIPNVADWEAGEINLKLVEIWQAGTLPGEGRLVLAYEFKFKSKKPDHQPSDRDHERAHLYKNPDSDEPDWVLDNAVHSDGGVHGGTAHMRQ